MKILISGSSGFIGANLKNFLIENGCEVKRLVRKTTQKDDEISWDIPSESYELKDFEGFDAFINLSGENIFGIWTESKKKRIVESRLNTTTLLTKIIKKLKSPPATFISASAIGFYGNRGDELLDEYSQKGSGFFPELADEWEKSANLVIDKNLRVVNLRIGLVLSKNGGALEKMLTPFRFGLGGNIGNGNMYWSWISLNDLLSAVLFILNNRSIKGAVNMVSEHPLRNKEFTKILGKVLSRPTVLPVPTFLIKTLLGEFGDEALLASTRVIPKKLIDAGFNFKDSDLEKTLTGMLA